MFRQLLFQRRHFVRWIDQNTTGIKQTFGKAGGIFSSNAMLESGLRVYLPIIQKITEISNRQHQNNFLVTGRSSDGVIVDLDVSIQWKVNQKDSEKAFFSLDNPIDQIRSFVENSIRSSVANISIDDLFKQHNNISEEIFQTTMSHLQPHGYNIVGTLITNIKPDIKVATAMNAVNESLQLRQAGINRAETEALTIVAKARADSERMALTGIGMSKQRENILNVYSDSLDKMKKTTNISPERILSFIEKIQQYDTLRDISNTPNTKVIIVPIDLNTQTFKSIVSAKESVEIPTDSLVEIKSKNEREGSREQRYECLI